MKLKALALLTTVALTSNLYAANPFLAIGGDGESFPTWQDGQESQGWKEEDTPDPAAQIPQKLPQPAHASAPQQPQPAPGKTSQKTQSASAPKQPQPAHLKDPREVVKQWRQLQQQPQPAHASAPQIPPKQPQPAPGPHHHHHHQHSHQQGMWVQTAYGWERVAYGGYTPLAPQQQSWRQHHHHHHQHAHFQQPYWWQ